MEHPIFGTIEWMPDMGGWWTERVQLEFFSAYDTVVVAECGQRLGGDFWRTTSDQRYQNGDFELSLNGHDGPKPSARQEKAFHHFQKHRDVICERVVDAIFTFEASTHEFTGDSISERNARTDR